RNQRFFRRSFVQAHGGETQIREIIAGTINLKQGIERFPAAQWIMGDAQPKLLRLTRQIPFRSQVSKPNFMLGIIFARALGIVPSARRDPRVAAPPMVSLSRVMLLVSFDRVFCKNPSKAGRRRK